MYFATYEIWEYGIEGWDYKDEEYCILDTLDEMKEYLEQEIDMVKVKYKGMRSISRIHIYKIAKEIPCEIRTVDTLLINPERKR